MVFWYIHERIYNPLEDRQCAFKPDFAIMSLLILSSFRLCPHEAQGHFWLSGYKIQRDHSWDFASITIQIRTD